MWVPKLAEYPGRPGRQALRLTLENRKGQVIDLVESPSTTGVTDAQAIGQIVGQDYLGVPCSRGTSIVSLRLGSTSIGLISSFVASKGLYEIASQLIGTTKHRTSSGSSLSFTPTVTAPSTPGTYAFQWQMIGELVEVFGDLSPVVTITVQ